MKKTIALLVAVITLVCTVIPAFAVEPQKDMPEMLMQKSIMRLPQDMGAPINIVNQRVSKIDDFTVCSIIAEASDGVTAQSATEERTVWAFDYWYKGETLLGKVKAFGDFEYDTKTATIVSYSHQGDGLVSGASYFVSSQTAKNSTLLNKYAYYKMTYKFSYNGDSKTRTLEVKCSKDGEYGENGSDVKL